MKELKAEMLKKEELIGFILYKVDCHRHCQVYQSAWKLKCFMPQQFLNHPFVFLSNSLYPE